MVASNSPTALHTTIDITFQESLQYFLHQIFTGIQLISAQLHQVLKYPLAPNQRIFWLYLITSALFALLVFYLTTNKSERSPLAFFRFLFPRKVWQHPSA